MNEGVQASPRKWQNFILCMSLHVTLPLLPLGLELWFSGKVEAKSATLTAALYAMAIGSSSRNIALFGIGIVASFFFSAAFGFLSTQSRLAGAHTVSYSVIAFLVICHTMERYRRHVTEGRPFFEFRRN